jgi:hypothetical protein
MEAVEGLVVDLVVHQTHRIDAVRIVVIAIRDVVEIAAGEKALH